jgi:DNA-binding protein WhiA
MSFSSEIKDSLSKILASSSCDQKAELSGIVRTCGTISLHGRNKLSVSMRTEIPSVARLIFVLFKNLYSLHTEVHVKKGNHISKGSIYEIFIEDALEYLTDLEIITFKDDMNIINDSLPDDLIRKECCIRSYIRGFFLGCGSVSNPEKTYHLEFITHSENLANSFIGLLNNFDLNAKLIERKGNYIAYVKESEKIVDFLNIIGAHVQLLSYENIRVLKQMRNNVNRIVNCETANLSKVVDASYLAIENINKILKKRGIDSLPESLKEIAILRVENPEMSLKELGEMLSSPLTKSGVNHRIKKLIQLGEEID